MTIANELIKALTSSSKGSARSLQVAVGPSEFGGCRRKTWMRLNRFEPTNSNTLHLAAIMGTAIHSYIQEAFKSQDPFEDRFLLEQEFKHEDILVGHVDMYDKQNCEVVDWKTTKKSNLAYFPSNQQRWQVQLYGFLLESNGYKVDNVTLVAIPRDGDERDIVYHTEPYDKEIAMEAFDWLNQVKSATEPPSPEKDRSFCKSYCEFYDETEQKGCGGIPKGVKEHHLIDDPFAVLAARDYVEISKQINILDKQKEAAKTVLEGYSGITPEGIRVQWSSVAGRKSIDENFVAYFFEKHSEPLQYKVGKSSARLTVKQERE